MTGFEHPRNNKNEGEKPQERKLPDFIFVEEEEGSHGESYTSFQEQFYRSTGLMEKRSYSVALRFAFLVCSLFLLFIFCIALPFVIIFFLLNLLTLFKAMAYWERTKQLWGKAKTVFVTAMGLLIAVFSPPFGMAVIMVYFLLKGQSMEQQWVSRIMKERFNR
ncbi:MAG: hypothetical protein K940chlam7_01989 [Chlamydiae bacterium]|nr:hypothetical protein [Chlamydiota bacterium]